MSEHGRRMMTAVNYLKDVNASRTISLADKGITNAQPTIQRLAAMRAVLFLVGVARDSTRNPRSFAFALREPSTVVRYG